MSAVLMAMPNNSAPAQGHAAPPPPPDAPHNARAIKVLLRDFDFFYGPTQALKSINLPIRQNAVTAIIGPSGCGKSTLLRSINRMHDLYPGNRYAGEILLFPDAVNIVGPQMSALEMRLRVSMVFQKPNPFPKSIYENVAYGLRLRGVRRRDGLDLRVESALRVAALWDEVKDRLRKSAVDLSGGQQQRLCIARALATNPDVVLFDEPTSALDPLATSKIEELMLSLRSRVTIILVTHNMHQAARVSDDTAFMYLGELVEAGPTQQIFQSPAKPLTEQYITGRFG